MRLGSRDATVAIAGVGAAPEYIHIYTLQCKMLGMLGPEQERADCILFGIEEPRCDQPWYGDCGGRVVRDVGGRIRTLPSLSLRHRPGFRGDAASDVRCPPKAPGPHQRHP
jgi:hypothetical protein